MPGDVLTIVSALLWLLCAGPATAGHAVCSGHVPVSACEGGELVSDVTTLIEEIARQNESCASMQVVLAGPELGGLMLLQSSAAKGMGIGSSEAAVQGKPFCFKGESSFIASRLPAASSSELLRSMVPPAVNWCFHMVVSPDDSAFQAAVDRVEPDAVLLVRPASAFLHMSEKVRSPRKSVITWFTSMFYAGNSQVVRVNGKVVDAVAATFDKLRMLPGPQQPLLYVTGGEVAKAKGVLQQLRSALARAVPEAKLIEKTGSLLVASTLQDAYLRKYLALGDAVRELVERYEEVADLSVGHPVLSFGSRERLLATRIARHNQNQREYESAEKHARFVRTAILSVASAITAALAFWSWTIIAPVVPKLRAFIVGIFIPRKKAKRKRPKPGLEEYRVSPVHCTENAGEVRQLLRLKSGSSLRVPR
ncbi:hypothetical protein DIPPA_10220 [Diplonema papillatum]|nr:hypothetical protein DIPPA_10220 [Diplonema papillatum]